jgi:hypothetical protein
MRRGLGLGLIGSLMLFAAACGDDDGPDRDAYVAAVSEELQDPEDDSGLELDDDTADCTASALVSAIDDDDLGEIEPDDLGRAESLDDVDISLDADAEDQLRDDLADCDLEGAFVEAMVAEIGVDLPDEGADCLAGALDDDEFTDLLVGSLTEGSAEGEELLFETFADCPAVLAELFAAGIEESLGAELAREAVDCIAEQIEADPEAAVEAMSDEGAADAFGADVVGACPEIISG